MDIAKYYFKDGSTMEREYGTTPKGNPMGGRWVKRSAGGAKTTTLTMIAEQVEQPSKLFNRYALKLLFSGFVGNNWK